MLATADDLISIARRMGVLQGAQSVKAADPITYAARNLKVLDKAGQLVSLVYNAAQQDYLGKRTRRDLILKARQLGFSTLIQAELFRAATTGTAITATLSHDDEATQKLRRMADRFYQHLPDATRPLRKYANATLTSYPATHSEANIATAGNVHTGRGGTYTHVHCSEVAFYKDAESIMAGVLQGGDPAIALESTPNGAQGWFYERCMEALDGQGPWALHFYPWWWDATYRIVPAEPLALTDEEQALMTLHHLDEGQINWRRVKQAELKHLFYQEYPEDPRTCFLRSGFGYFGDLSGVFTAPLSPAWQAGHRYVAGLDFGQTVDYTACIALDTTAGQMVDMLRINRLPWADMRGQVADLCRRWHAETLYAESNSMGSTNIEALRSELSAAGAETALMSFDTTNETKFNAASALREALTGGRLRLQDGPELRHELNAFQATQLPSGAWRLAAAAGEHDDTVIALALAYHALVRGGAVWVA